MPRKALQPKCAKCAKAHAANNRHYAVMQRMANGPHLHFPTSSLLRCVLLLRNYPSLLVGNRSPTVRRSHTLQCFSKSSSRRKSHPSAGAEGWIEVSANPFNTDQTLNWSRFRPSNGAIP